jgi:hypothetical protein
MVKEIPSARPSRFDPLSLLWHALAAPQTLMLWLGLLALALVVASVVPQVPPQALSDPQTWLAVQSGPLASAGNIVRVLGLYDVYHSFWFHLLLAFTGVTLFVWMLDSGDLAWRASRQQSWSPAAFVHWGNHAPEVHVLSFLQPQETAARLCESLAERGYHWSSVPDLPVPNFVAVRQGIVLWSRPVALAGLLVTLAGLATAGIWGWQGPAWQPSPGDILAIGDDAPYRVRLDSFQPASETDGGVCDYRSEITWLRGDEPVAQGVAATGVPATFQGMTMRQVGYVPAVQLRVWDENGRPLELQLAGVEAGAPGRLDILFPSPTAQPLVLLPTRDLVLSLAFEPYSAGGDPLLRVTLFRDGATQPEPVGALAQSGSLTADGLQMDITLNYRPVLQASHHPAMGLVLGGLTLGLVALAVGWLVPFRLLWIGIAPGEEEETLVRLLPLPGRGPGRWLPLLAARLREALSGES